MTTALLGCPGAPSNCSIAVEHPQEFSSSDYFHEWSHIIEQFSKWHAKPEHIHDWDWISQELGLWVVWVLLSPYTPISLFWFHSMKLGLASSQETFMFLDTD